MPSPALPTPTPPRRSSRTWRSEDTLFAAHRFVSNGYVPDITHVVYVDPEGYTQLKDRADLLAVAEAVGKTQQTAAEQPPSSF